MKRCDYCGFECEDGAAYCARCGSADWRNQRSARDNEIARKRQPELTELKPPPAIIRKGAMTRINCRSDEEAGLVIEHLEAADIVPLISTDEIRKPRPGKSGYYPVQVSTLAYQSSTELKDVIEYDPAAASAAIPLGAEMSVVAVILPVLFPIGFFVFVFAAWNYSKLGLHQKAHDWSKWFGWGLAFWATCLALFLALR